MSVSAGFWRIQINKKWIPLKALPDGTFETGGSWHYDGNSVTIILDGITHILPPRPNGLFFDDNGTVLSRHRPETPYQDRVRVARSRAPGKVVHRRKRIRTRLCNVGCVVHIVLQWLGYRPTESCSCKDKAKHMDAWGPCGCLKNMSSILGWLRESWNERHKKIWFPSLAARILVYCCIAWVACAIVVRRVSMYLENKLEQRHATRTAANSISTSKR